MNFIRKYRKRKSWKRKEKLREKIVLALLKSPNHIPNVDTMKFPDSKDWFFTTKSTPYLAHILMNYIKNPPFVWGYKSLEDKIRKQCAQNSEDKS